MKKIINTEFFDLENAIKLIDRHLKGEMTSDQEIDFVIKLNVDTELRKVYNDIVDIKKASNEIILEAEWEEKRKIIELELYFEDYYLRNGQPTPNSREASTFIKKAIKGIENNAVNSKGGFIDSALEALEKAENIDPNIGLIFCLKSKLYSFSRVWTECIQSATRGINLETNPRVLGDCYFVRGYSYLMKEDFQNSINDFKISISKRSDFQPAIFFLGFVTKIITGEIEFNEIDVFILFREYITSNLENTF